jgi:cysteate synthase
VKVVTLADASYDEAIAFARKLAATDDFILEGGVQNVARRDGLGIVMLAATEAIGALPAAYVQAVGSAAGALGASEAAQRLIGDGRFGSKLPRLILAQNAPWSPIADAWSTRSATLPDQSKLDVQARLAALGAPVLSNQAPPYAIAGGVREALAASDGTVYAVDNEAMSDAMMLFARCEGIDIDPEAGVAVAALARAVAAGSVDPAAPILINITGGGRAARLRPSVNARPALQLHRNAFESTGADDVRALFSTTAR